jgi:hypothetical protein
MSDEETNLPATVDEAIQTMYAWLDEENRQILKAMQEHELIRLHHGYGTGIRNGLGLWGQNTALMTTPELKGMHPDDMSTYLIQRLWRYLQEHG